MYSNELKYVLEKIFENKELIENFRREIKNKTMELLAQNGYEKSEERMEQDMIEILDDFNAENDELSTVSGGVKNGFDLFKKAGVMTLAGLSMCSGFSKNSYATNNTNTSSSVVKKQEKSNSNTKNKFADFFKNMDAPQILTTLLIGSTLGIAGKSLAFDPLVKKFSQNTTNTNTTNSGNSNSNVIYQDREKIVFKDRIIYKNISNDMCKEGEFSIYQSEENNILNFIDQLKKCYFRQNMLDWLDNLKKFILKLCDHKEKLYNRDINNIQELLNSDPEITELYNKLKLNYDLNKLDLKDIYNNSPCIMYKILSEILIPNYNYKHIEYITDFINSMLILQNNYICSQQILSIAETIKKDFDGLFEVSKTIDWNEKVTQKDFFTDEKYKEFRKTFATLLLKYDPPTIKNDIKLCEYMLNENYSEDILKQLEEEDNSATLKEFFMDRCESVLKVVPSNYPEYLQEDLEKETENYFKTKFAEIGISLENEEEEEDNN